VFDLKLNTLAIPCSIGLKFSGKMHVNKQNTYIIFQVKKTNVKKAYRVSYNCTLLYRIKFCSIHVWCETK